MPKNKTHSGASKRFRVTGSGKIRREKAGMRHNLEKKPSKVTRRMSGTTEVAKADVKRAKKLLGLLSPDSRPRRPHDSPRQHQGVTTVARVKRAVNAQKKRRVILERAAGYRGQRSRLYRKAKEQVTHSLVYSYRDRAQEQGRLPQAVDPADQRRRPRQRHDLQPLHPGPAAWPASRSTARSWPTWPSTTRRRSPRSSRPPRPPCPRTSTRPKASA